MKTVRLVVVMSVCIAIGVAAGYRLALTKENNRLERNKYLARMTHERVWSERIVAHRDGDGGGVVPLAE